MLKKAALRRNKEFNVTIEYCWDVFLTQNKKCAITGDDLILDKSRKILGNASIDRIDSSKGYIKGNIWWVTKKINLSKQCHSLDEYLDMCDKAYNNKNNAKNLRDKLMMEVK